VAQAPVLQPEPIASSPERIIHAVAPGRSPTSDRSQPPTPRQTVLCWEEEDMSKMELQAEFLCCISLLDSVLVLL